MLLTFVLFPCGHAATDMAFLFVPVQDLPDLGIKYRIVMLQSLGYVFMYG